MKRFLGILWICAAWLALLSACGGEEESSPILSAPPTRTPLPPTSTPAMTGEANGPSLDNFTVISLRDEIDAFLTAAETASPLDRPDLFTQHVINAEPGCMDPSYFPGTLPLEIVAENLDLISIDLAAWRYSVDAFSEQDLIDEAWEALAQAAALLPTSTPLYVCLMPVPVHNPEHEETGVDAQVLGSDLIVVTCSDRCAGSVGSNVAFGYHYAYQLAQTGLTYPETPLLHFALYNARAADFTRHLFPGVQYPWTNALTPLQEAALWTEMQNFTATTYQDYPDYRRIPRFLYGTSDTTRYPTWGGIFIGDQIVRAYRASHLDVTFPELADMPPEDILDGSGYAPG